MYLPSIKTFVYTIGKNQQRQIQIKKMLTDLNFTDWSFFFGNEKKQPYWVNIHDDWIKVLDTPAPFLILEDDACVTEDYKPDIIYPIDSQLVYLGGTSNGEFCNLYKLKNNLLTYSNGPKNVAECLAYSERSDEYIQIFNMHSTHAVLFVNDYVKSSLKIEINTRRDIAVDVVFARWMWCYKVYCLKKPFWYQNDGHHNEATLKYYDNSDPGFNAVKSLLDSIQSD
jgi:hypothetical protein